MGLLDRVKDFEWQGLARAVRSDNQGAHEELQGEEEHGIASSNAAPRKRKRRLLSAEADDVRTNTIVRGTQTFFLLISLFILIAIAAFQSSNHVGPSALTGIAFVPVIAALLASVFLLVVPLVHDRTGKLKSINRNTSQVRFNVVIGGLMVSLLLLFAIIYSVSANVDGCKNADDDPHADKDGYKSKIAGHCRNKGALAAFLWFSFFAWIASLIITFLQWRSYRNGGAMGRPFEPPTGGPGGYDDAFDEPSRDEEEAMSPPQMSGVHYGDSSYARRQSGAYLGTDQPFNDPLPSGYQTDMRQTYITDGRQSAAPSYSDPYDVIRRELEFDSNNHTPASNKTP